MERLQRGPDAEEWEAALAAALKRPLVLASASPRRRDLLQQAGLDFEVRVSNVEEDAEESDLVPAAVAARHARRKAMTVAAGVPGRVVLGADTVVVLGGSVLGKPGDADQAGGMLRALSGREHQVITAVALALGRDGTARALAEDHARTRVIFRELSEVEIEHYVASGEPMDKAGAYGIQGRGALLVREIHGCYFNVVGLPLSLMWEMLQSLSGEGFPETRGPGV
ncbi:MAG: Maf family protein [Armatimonadota bacterium]|nr:Maf family protein [Armatimonadota bacterium]